MLREMMDVPHAIFSDGVWMLDDEDVPVLNWLWRSLRIDLADDAAPTPSTLPKNRRREIDIGKEGDSAKRRVQELW